MSIKDGFSGIFHRSFLSRAIKQVCEETKPFERSTTNMELQEIDDRLKTLAKEIEELEGRKEAYLFMENLLQEQERLILKVCLIHYFMLLEILFLSSVQNFSQADNLVPFIKAMAHMKCRMYPVVGFSRSRIK